MSMEIISSLLVRFSGGLNAGKIWSSYEHCRALVRRNTWERNMSRNTTRDRDSTRVVATTVFIAATFLIKYKGGN